MTGDRNNAEEETLQQRARELAQPPEQSGVQGEMVSLVEFALVGTRYAVHLESVERVSRVDEVFPLPSAPRHICGITRRRGQSIALVDLRRFFHPEAIGVADADNMVVLNVRQKCFALQVGEIVGVIRVGRAQLTPPPKNFASAEAPFISAVTTDGLAIIDLESLVENDAFSSGQTER